MPTSNYPAHDDVLLLLQVPRTNSKKELAAEQMFASLQGLLTMPNNGFFKPSVRERISFEIAVINKRIGFYVWVPEYLKGYVEEQVYAQYPTVQISEVEDFSRESHYFQTSLITEMRLTTHSALPIKTFQNFEVDPLASITAALAKFDETEQAWIQLIIRPASSDWRRRSERYIAGLRGRSSKNLVGTILGSSSSRNQPNRLTDSQRTRAAASEAKSQKLAFETCLRIVYRSNNSEEEGKLKLQSIIASYKQFNTTYLNGFEAKRPIDDPYLLLLYQSRDFNKKTFICNIEEIATLFHLPHTNVETPNILWALSQTAEPPPNLPLVSATHDISISPIAATNFRGHNSMFGLPRVDRSRHLYILGQTGVGKSGLLELMTISDIYSPYGFAIIDPHGDYATNILKRIPEERIDDVIYFNPSDIDFPIAFNPLEIYDIRLKMHTCSELIGVLKRMFDAWGPRLEYILRYSILALLDYPGATMLDITRILTDKQFREEVIKHINDPVVRNFWTVEFAGWSTRFANEAVSPVLNKIGAFTANPLVRNIIGQSKSSFNIRKIMDENKILIINLSRGLVGEDNAAILGALLVTKIQLAAMSRADISAEHRTPFYLYVDEFQNFATDSFTTIFSEARKYGLNLTVANQYIAQMMTGVRDAVFGNVGSVVSFRTSADDARIMQRYFEPKFSEHDLVQMHNRHFVISMTIAGEKAPAFSAISLNLPDIDEDNSETIIEKSRSHFAGPREQIELVIAERYYAPQPVETLEILKPAVRKKIPSRTTKKSKPKQQTRDEIVHTLVAHEIDIQGNFGLKKKINRSQKIKIPKLAERTSEITDFDNDSVVKLH
jgi:hypothetical protein